MHFLSVLVLFVCFTTSAQLYTFKNYNHRDGLITESTLSAKQDNNGYLWIGTDGEGLMRFDGKRFVEIGPKNNRLPFHVSDIYHHSDGSTYFTTLYDGIYRLKPNKEYEFVYKPSGIEGDCRQISMVDSSLVLITDRSITLLSKKGIPIRKNVFIQRERTIIRQQLKIPQGVIVFTSNGNFIVRNKQIQSLNTWLGKSISGFHASFATFSKNKLILYSKDASERLEITLTNNNEVFTSKKITTSNKLPENCTIFRVVERQHEAFLILSDNRIYKLHQNKLQFIVQNYSGSMDRIAGACIDSNNDLWLTGNNGLFKISIEPFTKIELDPIYNLKNIGLIYRTKENKLILSTMSKELYVGSLYSTNKLTQYNYRATQVLECEIGTFISCDKGIFELKGDNLVPTDFPFQKEKPITMMFWDGINFWYSQKGEGIIRYEVKTKKTTRYQRITYSFPTHFYSAQKIANTKSIYFGTNNGILKYDLTTQQFIVQKQFLKFGSYCGNSTVDRFGNCWFTLDKALVGITKNGESVMISDPKKLPSTLFYTLTADYYGNLIVGTNRGINVIKVDRNGNVLHQKNYGNQEGFGGYETHMRANFQSGNFSYVGTIEGLFLINTDILENYPKPSKPIILTGRENEKGQLITYDEKSYYTFKCLLAKSNGILYSYRIKGFEDKWSDFSNENEIYIPELSNGNYILEVRASYDGITISETGALPLLIQTPLWKSKWFFVLLVVLLGIVNIGYLEWSKSFLSSNIIDTKDTTVDVKIVPRIILFGAVVNGIMLFVVEIVEPKVFSTLYYNLLFSPILFLCYFASRSLFNKIDAERKILGTFYLAYALILIEDFVLIFQTNVHPFPLFSVVITTGVLPFILSKIRWVVIICLTQLFVAAAMLIWLEDTLYNELLFIAAITISGALAVMVSYLRNDSLEKLIFVSGVVNKGNVMAISFDQRGTITYCSSNISNYFNLESNAVVGKSLKILNSIIVSSEMREINLDDAFEDGKIFLVPMYNAAQEVVWIEWSCKFFNEGVRVIMGQDVTDKLTLSTNYKSLVENAQDMIYNTDIFGNFIFANERTVQQFGFKNDNLTGKNAITLIPSEHRANVQQFYENQFANRIHHTYLEFPIKSRDGKLFWVGQNVTMVYEPGSRKRISGFIALARDITEKRANDLLIAQQNKDITSSINSAKRIQFNLLPKANEITSRFEQSFILYKPKDIVSGDFYWVEEADDKLIMVLADCTGHGVPGAFMTILGINLLNQLVRERKVTTPDAILTQLHSELAKILTKNGSENLTDSMDVLVCVFEPNKLSVASSGVGLIHVCGNQSQLIRQTKITESKEDSYSQIVLETSQEDQFYLVTDGYQKQFGSIRNKKFTFKRMRELMEKITPESMALQKKYFENAWRNWSEGHEQTDDITIIGVKGFHKNKLKNEE